MFFLQKKIQRQNSMWLGRLSLVLCTGGRRNQAHTLVREIRKGFEFAPKLFGEVKSSAQVGPCTQRVGFKYGQNMIHEG